MKKRILCGIVSAVLVLTGVIVPAYLMKSKSADAEEVSINPVIAYSPYTELSRQVSGSSGQLPDFGDSMFSFETKYYTPSFTTMKNYTTGTSTITVGGTSNGGPGNWWRYCAFTLNETTGQITSNMATSSGTNRITFTAPVSGLYEIVPAAVSGGNSLRLNCGDAFANENATFKILSQSGLELANVSLSPTHREDNISAGNNKISRYLSLGEKLYFTTTISKSWIDNVSVDMNFSVNCRPTVTGKQVIFDPTESIKELYETRTAGNVPAMEFVDFTAQIAYYGPNLTDAKQVSKTSTAYHLGSINNSVNNWNRYCSFIIPLNGNTITSSMATGNAGSKNRLTFIAPEDGYYSVVPDAVSQTEPHSVKLDVAGASFGTNTATLEITKNGEEIYSTVLCNDNGDGQPHNADDIRNAESVYLCAGDHLEFTTYTSAGWYDYSNRCVEIKMNFKIALLAEKTEVKLNYNPAQEHIKEMSGRIGLCSFREETYDGEDFVNMGKYEYNPAYRHLIVGDTVRHDGNNYNTWQRYCAFDYDGETGLTVSKLGGSGFKNKLIFTAPRDGKYCIEPISGNNLTEVYLGDFADKFTGNVTITYDCSPTAKEGNTNDPLYVEGYQTSGSNEKSKIEVNLSAGEELWIISETDEEWFDYAASQTISVIYNFNIVEKFGICPNGVSVDFCNDGSIYASPEEYDFCDDLRPVLRHAALTSVPKNTEQYEINFTGNYSLTNRYFKDNTKEYAIRSQNTYSCGDKSWDENIYRTYGSLWFDGERDPDNQLLRGAFTINDLVCTNGKTKNSITATMGTTAEKATQTMEFVAPVGGYYIVHPKAISEKDYQWLKSTNANYGNVPSQLNIRTSYGESLFTSAALNRGEGQNDKASILVYLNAGEKIILDFTALGSSWNFDTRLTASFTIDYCSPRLFN